ncbi:transmembrane GTPase fzo1 [Mitosporidium daphniae]|uniref:Transmembrane GTPase fzo1 n=1 Tax=Mitosporidium daphniae TaxID=1485682 RepID=A0A098VY63_9MICR|nr:transmembrane GTPase fzo1 [Mitosporidium daphniae]KGG52716.1 transmembrane GTPase fzo1 [Mitosporidium daphniae]|eukprot:XP_013239181.1 transmembrane GTPase fzo1 [Mitosporidium daphniae]
MQASVILPSKVHVATERNVVPNLDIDAFNQFSSFPSTLVSPSFSTPSSHHREETLVTESTYETRKQSLMKLLNETLDIVSDLESKIEISAPGQNHNGSGGESLSFPSSFTFRFPIRSGQIKILHLSLPPSARSPQLSILEDDLMTRRLLLLKLHSTLTHIERLKLRLLDSSVRILVTGDVNSGKSTLINALLGLPEFLVIDQQPCTSAYCEVVLDHPCTFDPQLPVHAIPRLEGYSPEDKSSFRAISTSEMQHLSAGSIDSILEDGIERPYAWFRIFLQNSSNLEFFSASQQEKAADSSDILPFSCSIIDSPGLNHDTFQTMSLFARQDDIDILIFASEFLNEASREKEKIFIVVNKFDDIKDKQKCRRIVMQQIANLLPATYKDADRLVHFVSAKDACHSGSAGPAHQDLSENFVQFLKSLSSWATSPELRAKTKLGPPATFIGALLNDILYLSLFNISAVEAEIRRIVAIAAQETPLEEKLAKSASFFVDPSYLDCEGDIAARAALSASLEQLGALVDGGGLLVSARLVQVSGAQWPGSFALFSIPGWICAFSKTLEAVVVSQLAICKSISVGHGCEGASRIHIKARQILPEIFDRSNLDELASQAASSGKFSDLANSPTCHTPDLSAFKISGWAILLDIRSELFQIATCFGTLGAVTGLTGLAFRLGLSSTLGTIAETYFKYGHMTRSHGHGSSGRGIFSPSLALGSVLIAAIGFGAITLSRESLGIDSKPDSTPSPGRFETHLREKVATSIVKKLQSSCWKEYESAALATITRDATRASVLDVQTRFQIHLAACTRRQASREAYISLLEDRHAYFRGLQRKCNVLLTELEATAPGY